MKRTPFAEHARSPDWVERSRSRLLSMVGATLLLLIQLWAPAAFATIVDPEYTAPILDPATQNKWLTPIPNALMAEFTYTPYTDAAAQAAGFPAGVCGVTEDCYTVSAKQFQQNLGLVDEVTRVPLLTNVYGHGTATNAPAVGPFVGSVWHAPSPTFRNTSNRPTRIIFLNELPNTMQPGHDPTVDGGPNAPNNYPYNRHVTHVHGAHVQDDSDGNPEAWYTPGFTLTGTNYRPSTWGPLGTYRFENTQEAATVWYHEHASGVTHLNTQMGMAGFFLITDDNEKCLQGQVVTGCAAPVKVLPTDPYEVGFALQDRNFWPDGSIAMPDLPVRDLLSPACLLDPFGQVIPDTCPTVPFSKAADGHLIPFDAGIADPLLRGPFTATNTTLEYFGNMPLVNGVVYGKYDVEPRVYRMRFIGGTDSRTWGLQLVRRDNLAVIPFWQIGTEQGFLDNPVQRTLIDLMPGERIDALVDLKGIPTGTKIVLQNLGPDTPYGGPPIDLLQASTVIPEIMEFNVVAINGAIADVASPTVNLNLRPVSGAIAPLPAPTAPVRNVSLIEVVDQYGRTTPTIDDRGFMQAGVPITEIIKLNDVEQWDIINTTVDAHPIHLHLVAFQVIDRQLLPPADPVTGLTPGFVAPVTDIVNNIFTQPQYVTALGSVPVPPDPWEAGWKDTIDCPPGMVTRVKAKFDIAGLYVWHCHILSHEEHDMMRPFKVAIPPTGVTLTPNVTSPQPAGTQVTLDAVASGGTPPYEYEFWRHNGVSWTNAQTFSTNSSFVWDTTPAAGIYTFQVNVRFLGSSDSYQSFANAVYQVNPAAATGVTLVPDKTSPQPTTVPGGVTFTAAGQGGSGSYEYEFWMHNGASWSKVQAYSANANWVWNTAAASAGYYTIQVNVRSAGSTVSHEAYKAVAFKLTTASTATGATLVPDKPSPQPTTTPGGVTFTAAGQGGSGSYEFEFWMHNGVSWTKVQNMSATATWNWNTALASPGIYTFQVNVRSAGSTAAYEAYQSAVFELQ